MWFGSATDDLHQFRMIECVAMPISVGDREEAEEGERGLEYQ